MHAESIPIRITVITLDGHLGSTIARTEAKLRHEIADLELSIHPASEWENDKHALAACHADIATANIIICTMLFVEPHINAVLPQLKARAPHCDAIVGAMSGTDIVKLTRMGKLNMGSELKGPLAMLRKLRGSKKPGQSSGASQMKMLRRLPKLLKYVPGTAQDLRVYFIILQCWLAGSEVNISNMIRLLIKRYSGDQRVALRDQVVEQELIEYPENGLYHAKIPHYISDQLSSLPITKKGAPSVGLLLMRSYVLAENTRHYDAVISALESKGLNVIPAFASGLDARPAIEKYFVEDGRCNIDILVSLTGFSLVGGPAYNDAAAAVEAMSSLNVPYIAAHPSEFQSLQQWQDSEKGLTPIETTMMVAIPELDGATGSIVYAGHESAGKKGDIDKQPIVERVDRLACRITRCIELKHADRATRKLAIVLFNFPPNAGAVGTAAYLGVFASLFNTLKRLKAEGYSVELPHSVDDLRQRLIVGNSASYGTDANVLTTVSCDDHVRNTPWLEEIEAHWGSTPGKQLSNGQGLFVLGLQLGNITIGLQPGFGYEGDPMRLLFENGTAPTHAFSAFYQHLRKTLGVHALLHFGTHGALEFMSGKQSGLSGACWPERLIGDTPNFYFYAANNPSEGAIAKRRSAATLISYLTPSITEAGLYQELQDLKASIAQWNQLTNKHSEEANDLLGLIKTQSDEIEFSESIDWSGGNIDVSIEAMQVQLRDIERELIPNGMHVIGEVPTIEERCDFLSAFMRCADNDINPTTSEVAELLDAHKNKQLGEPEVWQEQLIDLDKDLCSANELNSLISALDLGYIPAVPGGDILRNRETLPTGRNIHGFDPFRLPSVLAQTRGVTLANRLLERHKIDTGNFPGSVAFVLWGSDNLKNEGIPIAQAMALMGAKARFDGYGKLAGAELIPLAELGRARVDVMITLSGVFRDLFPLQTRMLAEAALLASSADEPLEQNLVRAHTLQYQKNINVDFSTAALRVFSNSDGAYGANVNLLIDSGAWDSEDELADTYASRKCFAFGAHGTPIKHPQMLDQVLSDVDLAYQNLESVELGVTQLDYYFDTLGGINSMVKKARGSAVPTYIGDQTRGDGTVRTLQEQVALETRTRMLNPKWYEGQLKHGYEGVRSIEASITNTLGWSATSGQVAPWVYNQVAQTFVLDEDMRNRLADLNPIASARMANRLIEATERNYWSPNEDVLQALHDAGDELEDRLEGVHTGAAA